MALRLDLGCGPRVLDGFLGVDLHDYGNPNIIVADLREPWKWDDASVDEVVCRHFVEHLTARERIHFANELHRVLKADGTAEIIVPHWSGGRAYGDLTHQWPPVSEFWFYYLSKAWREKNAPHASYDYTCDFSVDWGFTLDARITVRNQEFQQFASDHYRDAVLDIQSTWRKASA